MNIGGVAADLSLMFVAGNGIRPCRWIHQQPHKPNHGNRHAKSGRREETEAV